MLNYRVVLLVATAASGIVNSRDIRNEHSNSQLAYMTNPFTQEKFFPEFGWFNVSNFHDPTHRPFGLVPADRDSINTRFGLYSRKNKPGVNPKPQFIRAGDADSIRKSDFNAEKPVKFVLHGFLDTGYLKWLNLMGNAILAVEDANVIAVDWSGGSGPPYTQATANTWVVGGELALLTKFLVDEFGVTLDRVHYIGHSLGAHASGYASTRLGKKVARITALDPAEPFFQYMPEHVRIDAGDAKFVDAIHTDGASILQLGFGMIQPVGHLDFYPNRGMEQPGCTVGNSISSIFVEGVQEAIRQFVACNHMRAIEYFTESILSGCPFLAHQCDTYENYRLGGCNSCGADGMHCAKMGYYADTHPDKVGVVNRKLYLTTHDKAPFCHSHYLVKVTVDNNRDQADEKATLHASFKDSKTHTDTVQFNTDAIILKGGHSYAFVVGIPKKLDKVTLADFYWKSEWTILESGYWHKSRLFVSSIEVGPIDVPDKDRPAQTSKACRRDTKTPIGNKEQVTFRSTSCPK